PTPFDTSVTLSGGTLTVTGGSADDTLTISRNGSNVRITDPNHTVGAFAGTQVDPNTVEVPLSSITNGIIVNTNDGNDTLTLALAGGNFLANGGLTYNGGPQATTPGDKLVIT